MARAMEVTRLASALRTADIAHPAHGLDDAGAAGVLDLGTQVRDVYVDVVGVALENEIDEDPEDEPGEEQDEDIFAE